LVNPWTLGTATAFVWVDSRIFGQFLKPIFKISKVG
jgi:hypothetical protein